MKDFFGRKSHACFSRNVFTKSYLTAGYVDPNILLIELFRGKFFQDLGLEIIVFKDIFLVLAK